MRFIIVALLIGSGCATLFSGGPQPVTFSSNPAGAQVLIDGMPAGVTPMTTMISRETFQSHYVTLRYPGYEAPRFMIEKSLNTIAILNLSSGCFWLTDALTGAMIEYSPNAYHFELRPAAGPAPMPGPMPGALPPGTMPPPPPPRGAWHPTDSTGLWFVLVNHNHLRTEVSRQGGEYLRTLADVWHVDYERLKSRIADRHTALLSARFAYDFYVELRRSLAETT
jgi:hypothetical protein